MEQKNTVKRPKKLYSILKWIASSLVSGQLAALYVRLHCMCSPHLHWFFNLPASKACSNHIPSSISRGSSIVATSGGLQSTAKWRTINARKHLHLDHKAHLSTRLTCRSNRVHVLCKTQASWPCSCNNVGPEVHTSSFPQAVVGTRESFFAHAPWSILTILKSLLIYYNQWKHWIHTLCCKDYFWLCTNLLDQFH